MKTRRKTEGPISVRSDTLSRSSSSETEVGPGSGRRPNTEPDTDASREVEDEFTLRTFPLWAPKGQVGSGTFDFVTLFAQSN